jgi:hypothetical protein
MNKQKQKNCKKSCERCGYEGKVKYRERWGKVLCEQCNLDHDNPSQEELESRIGIDF